MKIKLKIILSLFILIIIVFAYVFLKKDKNDNAKIQEIEVVKDENVFQKHGELKFIAEESDKIIKQIDIEIAKDDFSREKGLMYRRIMAENQGMLFIFDNEEPRYFWMKNTYISLDIIYVSKDKKVVSIQKSAVPLSEESLPSYKPAQYVVEVNAGFTDKYGVKEGVKIDF